MIHLGPPRAGLLPGLLFLLALLVIGGLLVAGFGVSVGVGLLVGLLVGTVAGVAIVISMNNRMRAYGVSYDTASSHMFGESVSIGTPDPMRAMERVRRVDHGPLLRVVAGGPSVDASGVTVELIAIELRASGAVAHLTAAAAPPAMMTGAFAQVAIEDDRGTAYVAAGFGGNASPDRMRYEVRFSPVPPPDATEIRIRIEAFLDPFPRPGAATTTGPWLLTVPID
jgi:hypothetical protein